MYHLEQEDFGIEYISFDMEYEGLKKKEKP